MTDAKNPNKAGPSAPRAASDPRGGGRDGPGGGYRAAQSKPLSPRPANRPAAPQGRPPGALGAPPRPGAAREAPLGAQSPLAAREGLSSASRPAAPSPEAPKTPETVPDLTDFVNGDAAHAASGPAMGALTSFKGYPARKLPAAGAEADIYILDTPDGKQILKLYRYGLSPKEEVLQKLTAISKIHARHVVRLFESGYDYRTQCWYEQMEYAEHGSLAGWLASSEPPRPILEEVVGEICEAIDALQSSDMVHRDIKPSNILIRNKSPLDLVLSDFGITSVMHDSSIRATSRNFTPEYAPPEMDVASKAG
ncbi:MAG: protein kinase, partial [Deltaproteobacteria bacterium]|nr:protein kinase [Deltaproteobacteria bacterium]